MDRSPPNEKNNKINTLNHSPGSVIQFEEYYENNPEENQEENPDENSKDNKLNEENINIDNDENDEFERQEMENEYELVKSLNDMKEKNKKLESINKFQKIKIESLEEELNKAFGQIKIKENEIEELKNPNNNNKNTQSNQNKNSSYVSQINNLNIQIDKYKNLVSDKKSEYNTLLEKFNDIQKKYNQCIINERKTKQELINKDKQIAKLLDELDKKNIVITSTTEQKIKDKEIDKLVQENKKLEKQKNEIYAAFKKSLKLCSILKRQKVHLENARLLAFTEDEFKNLLEQNKI
jgi:hypothetical protein